MPNTRELQVKAICKMSGKETVWPCSASGCPLFGDCIAKYREYTKKPMTNADRIRAMSDEELEKFINHFNICDLRTNEECKMSYCACCEVCVMDWLKQPAEETP